jgi:hypothetical protein
VLLILEVQQRPELLVSFQNNMAATAAITAIWSALGIFLIAVQMGRARPSVPGAATNFYVINKIGRSHLALKNSK